jgi:hypothetical protein
MGTLERRLRKLEGHGTPKPELVKEWASFIRAMQGFPGAPVLTSDEIIEEAWGESAKGWTPAQMAMQTLQEVWEEHQR